MDNFDFSIVWQFRDALLRGLLVSIELSAVCAVLGIACGFPLSLARQSRFATLRAVSALYVEIIRGLPVLITLFWVFFCLPLLLGLEIGAFGSSVIALTLYMAAVSSEAFRSALAAIGRDQHDACRALGLSHLTAAVFVVAPQAFVRAIPNLLSCTVSLFKESALVSAVGMVELMYVGQNISNVTARPVEILTVVALIYFVIGFALTRVVNMAETRILIRIGS